MKKLREFSGPAQLLFKSLADLEASNPLVVLPPEPGLPALFGERLPAARYQYFDYPMYLRDGREASRAKLVYSAHWQAEAPHDLACIFLPKGRALMEYVFSGVASVLAPDATVLVVGAKKSGIVSSRDLVERYLGAVLGTRRGRHSVLLRGRKSVAEPRFEGEERYGVSVSGTSFEVVSLPGTFSYGRLDEGTAFLLERFAPGEACRVLDFGCGCGVLGTAVQLRREDAEVDFVDSDVLALESTRRTLLSNGLATECVRPSDVLSAVEGRYDLILTNPPFHTGHDTDFTVTRRLIKAAGEHLTREGRLVLVANSFIDYGRHLKPRFEHVATLAKDRRFQVVEAGRPRPAIALRRGGKLPEARNDWSWRRRSGRGPRPRG